MTGVACATALLEIRLQVVTYFREINSLFRRSFRSTETAQEGLPQGPHRRDRLPRQAV